MSNPGSRETQEIYEKEEGFIPKQAKAKCRKTVLVAVQIVCGDQFHMLQTDLWCQFM